MKSGGGQKVTGNPAELKASLEAEASKASLKTSVLTDTLNISVKDFASMFVDEAGSYGLTKYVCNAIAFVQCLLIHHTTPLLHIYI